ncbi:MAG: asparagine synthase (glutamine-hydrolyzing) [Pseudomonadota bacterium]
MHGAAARQRVLRTQHRSLLPWGTFDVCGLAGLLRDGPVPAELLGAMAGVLAHRGPDDQGVWTDPQAGIGLAHRRLSIVDLSPLGHQPMASADGRFVLAYNGEIYNHLDLRTELDERGATAWRGHSDTETLVESIAVWGLKATLERAVGMFALALWDRRDRTLSLARDRFGEKPLYYGSVGGDFAFASELRAMRLHPEFDNPIARDAVNSLVSRAYIGGPLSIYRSIFKLEPGTILTVPTGGWRSALTTPPHEGDGGPLKIERFWSYREVVGAGLADPITDEAAALDQLEAALGAAIQGQAVADVPVGAFLSGGIDSSLVVALYHKYWPGRVKTFTIGFDDPAFNEATHAKEFAAFLGTEHHERYVTPQDALDVIAKLPAIYDEPFADSSQIPTFLVSQLAREHVTVALSGDGGDELFGGYNRYFGTIRLWSALARLPAPARKTFGRLVAQVPPGAWNAAVALKPGGGRPAHFGNRVRKVFRTLGSADSLSDYVDSFLDEWARGASPVLAGDKPLILPTTDLAVGPGTPDAVAMMYADAVGYMRDDILCKVDRAAMAVSLETRVPFLDHRVAATAARIPIGMKIAGGQGKKILRKLLYRNAPAAMFERPKAGFAVPVGEWLRGPLRDWAEALLDERRIRAEGYFDAAVVRARWDDHLAGRDATASLWSVLMFQAWLDADADRAQP